MSDDTVEDFQADSGASGTSNKKASTLKKGSVCLINNNPCRVTDMKTAKTGKHGGAKVHLTAINLFTAKKVEVILGSTCDVEVPVVLRTDFCVNDVDDQGYLDLMDEAGGTRQDLKIPNDEIGEKINKAIEDNPDYGFLVTVLKVQKEEKIVDCKPSKPEKSS